MKEKAVVKISKHRAQQPKGICEPSFRFLWSTCAAPGGWGEEQVKHTVIDSGGELLMGFSGALLRWAVPAKCMQALCRVEAVIFLTEMSAAQLGAQGLMNTNALRQIWKYLIEKN